MYRLFVMLTHVASQLMRRWLAPPLCPVVLEAGEEVQTSCDLFKLSRADWLSLVLWWRDRCDTVWIEPFLRRHDPTGELWADATWRHLQAIEKAGGDVVTIADPCYPWALEAIADPPLALGLLGDVGLLQAPMVAVVGSRKASALAMKESHALGEALARQGIVTVSGGAFGCDIAAHLGVLASGLVPAPAVTVFAGGLHAWYPRGNRPVFDRLRAASALFVSERLWHDGVRPHDFAARNRIISGLVRTVCVMQAARRSGALVTARLALDQGREVRVLLHPPGDVRAAGSDELLAAGAKSFAFGGELRAVVGDQADAKAEALLVYPSRGDGAGARRPLILAHQA